MILNAIHGFCMALADSVPGVSGGTVAYVLGFYERFINSMRTVLSADSLSDKKKPFFYLCNLAVGWVIGMGMSIIALSALFEKNIYMMSSVFMGLTLAALPFIIRSEKACLKGRYVNLIWTAVGAAIVIVLTVFRGQSMDMGQINLSELNPGMMIYLVISGAVAITAMVLPGISGSTILLIMGVYLPIITALREITRGNLQVLPAVICVAVGIVLGMAVAVRAIRAAFRHFRTQVVYLIIGLLIGSFVAIAYGPTTVGGGLKPLSMETLEVTGVIIGIVILCGLEALPKLKRKAYGE